jgi:hypothetical protein
VSVTDFYRRRVLKASPPPLLSPILWFLPSCSLLKSRPDRAHSLEYAPVGRLACIGCQNGLVCVFDLRRQGSGGAGGSRAGQGVVGEASVLEHSHHDPVRDVFWISSKTGPSVRLDLDRWSNALVGYAPPNPAHRCPPALVSSEYHHNAWAGLIGEALNSVGTGLRRCDGTRLIPTLAKPQPTFV